MMGKVHLLPGTTFADVQCEGRSPTRTKTAAMTLDEVERWLGYAITGVYHRGLHRGIGTHAARCMASAVSPAMSQALGPRRAD